MFALVDPRCCLGTDPDTYENLWGRLCLSILCKPHFYNCMANFCRGTHQRVAPSAIMDVREKLRRRLRKPLIEPKPTTSQPQWSDVESTLQTELEKIVNGEELPISMSARGLQGDVPCILPMPFTCSDTEKEDDEHKTGQRKLGKQNR